MNHAPATQAHEKNSLRLLLEKESTHHGSGVGDLEVVRILQVNTTLLAAVGAELETAILTTIADDERMTGIKAVMDEMFHEGMIENEVTEMFSWLP